MEIEQVLGSNGTLAANVQGFRYREGQVEVAEKIMQSMREDTSGVMLIEAGTGIGKSFAYLAPALLNPGRTIVSTGTISLQDQLLKKDIPEMMKALGVNRTVVVLKGCSNYVCKLKMDKYKGSGASAYDPGLAKIDHWLTTPAGRDGDLHEYPDSYPNFGEITTSSDECVKKKCPHFTTCHYYRKREAAKTADMVIVNHPLYLLDARGAPTGQDFLGEHSKLIVDEAHKMQEAAVDAFTTEVSLKGVIRSADRFNRLKQHNVNPKIGRAVMYAGAALFSLLDHKGSTEYKMSDVCGGQKRRAINGVSNALLANVLTMANDLNEWKQRTGNDATLAGLHIESSLSTCKKIADGLQQCFYTSTGQRYIRYISKRERADDKDYMVIVKPIIVDREMQKYVYTHRKRVYMLSATLASGQNFGYTREFMGVSKSYLMGELIVPSPFDYANRTVLYIPDGISEPPNARIEKYDQWMFEQMLGCVKATKGGAFLLFTSWSSMIDCYKRFEKAKTGFTLFKQGDKPFNSLVGEFRKDGNGVLFGTSTFWEGVDVAGDALRCVAIDRIPFPNPSNPVVEERVRQMKMQGRSWFETLYIPYAQIRLKQGLGRLMRRESDSGILAILDNRLNTKGYSGKIIKALPPAKQLKTLAQVGTALERISQC